MKALVLKEKDQPLYFGGYDDPITTEDEVIVKLKAAALNRRDFWITQGLYPGIFYPVILGSDGAGICDGREVIINPAIGWGSNPKVQAGNFQVLGLPKNGAFAEKLAVGTKQIYEKPAHLSWEKAAALPLAGLTAFRCLFSQGNLQKGEKLLISGIGGGVALLACQFALAAGAEVFVTSGSTEKIERAMQMGAAGGVNYRDENWAKQLATQSGGFDFILESAAGEGFSSLVKTCKPGGRVVIYGGTKGYINKLSPQIIFWKQLSITGSTMGSEADFAGMLDFVNQHRIIPVVDSVFALSEGNKAIERMGKSLQFGKIVLKIQ